MQVVFNVYHLVFFGIVVAAVLKWNYLKSPVV